MNIVFLAPANSVHTQKWCKWFTERRHKVSVISLTVADCDIGVPIYYLNTGVNEDGADWKKIRYFTKIYRLKALLNKLKPDVVSVHYATSYGMLAALSGVKHYIVSVWGADVYDFPKKSWWHKKMLEFSLKRASRLFSTSQAMADEAAKYTDKHFDITPFGVDMELFNSSRRKRQDDDFVIGTVKTLSPKYGIATLLKAAAKVRNDAPNIPLKIKIAGRGSHEVEYHALASALGLDDCLTWLGFISQEEAANAWANFDCAIIPSESESESFGVSAVEAQSCGAPVIISDIPGLMEATKPGETSVVIQRGNVNELAQAIIEMYYSYEKRIMMGKAGRAYVKKNFEINSCFRVIEQEMEVFYKETV